LYGIYYINIILYLKLHVLHLVTFIKHALSKTYM